MITRKSEIEAILIEFQNDPSRLMDVLWSCHQHTGYVSKIDLMQLSAGLGVSVAHIEEVLSFYHFFRQVPSGRHTIYLDNSIVAQHAGMEEIKKTFETELGIKLGQVTIDGHIGLFETSCIGMGDQSPAALIDFFPVTNLTVDAVRKICRDLKADLPIQS
ncbi:MAG: NAD(P)H-dependent oxidoreductase subunit E, partial [Pseudobdellovibrionaceae bacterium]